MSDQTAAGPLAGVRVIDVTTPLGEMAGRVLADLGAEVIKIELPGGSASRYLPPLNRTPHHQHKTESLFWRSLGLGKKSIVIDYAGDECSRLRSLINSADVFIESFEPGITRSLAIDYDAVKEDNPKLIYASISAFGQSGPKANLPATDLILQAAGGLLSVQGDRDRPALPLPLPQAGFHTGVQAAADIVIALNRQSGQHLDVSGQCSVIWILMNATGYPPNTGGNPPGTCEQRSEPQPRANPDLKPLRMVSCRDGNLVIGLHLPGIGERTLNNMAIWLSELDVLPQHLRRDWSHWMRDMAEGRIDVDSVNEISDVIRQHLGGMTKAEIQKAATARKFLLAPINRASDLFADPQLQDRSFWREIDNYSHAGPFAIMSRTPLGPHQRAPELDQHAKEILFNKDHRRAATKVDSGQRREVAKRIFDGLKVADFAWVGVGPIISKAFADHGATVVHVESSNRPDVLRMLPPFKEGERGINRSQFQANFNSSKLGLALDMTNEKGKALGRQVADWADVVVESFTPGTMHKLGLDYDSLSTARDDLVMLSTCMRGQTGPERSYSGFGNQGAALSGLFEITGWPDRVPCGPFGAYTDFISPRFGVAALASALYYRNRTGKGQYIDLSQIEASIRFMEPLLLEYQTDNVDPKGVGHASSYACPHGVYATNTANRFIAIAVETETHWLALASLVDFEVNSASYTELEARLGLRDKLESTLRAFCSTRDPHTLEGRLQQAGVPSHMVLWPTDLYKDPQLLHRGFFVTLRHTEMGETPYDGPATIFSATPPELTAAPCLGEHTQFVLEELLRLDAATIESFREVLV